MPGNDIKPYAILDNSDETAMNAVEENIDSLEPSDLQRIKLPSGGGTAFELPSLDDTDYEKSIRCIILHHKTNRAYWESSLEESGGGTPPTCFSDDGKIGRGNPGGECAKCPYNQWGSGDGNSKACKELRVLAIARPDEFIPNLLALPPTSIKPFKQYMLQLASAKVPYNCVETEITLSEEKSQSGIKFAKAHFKMIRRLEKDEVMQLKSYRDSMFPALQTLSADKSDYKSLESK